MSLATNASSADRVVLKGVSWETYERLVRDFENRKSARFAFDRGVLEIMSPHLKHELVEWALESIVVMALEKLDRDFIASRHTTFKRNTLQRGFEADSSFYIRNVDRVSLKDQIDLEVDPPPDLVIEIDMTRDSLNKLPLYASLRIPEVWIFNDSLNIFTLERTRYLKRRTSVAIPILTAGLVQELLKTHQSLRRPAWLRQTRTRIDECSCSGGL